MSNDQIIALARESAAPGSAVIATDAGGRIVYWNEGAELLYGWTGDEVMGRPIVDVTPSDLTRAQAADIMTTLRSGRRWSGEFTVRARDGRRFEASVVDVPVRDGSGAVIGVVGISRKIAKMASGEGQSGPF